MEAPATIIEVFADVVCPFTYVGLQRFAERRAALGRDDVRLWVRSWPLEVVNEAPVEATLIAEEIVEIRAQVASDLFADFREDRFPASSIAPLALVAHAYLGDVAIGEAVSVELRRRLFERGQNIASPAVLTDIVERHGVDVEVDALFGPAARRRVMADHEEGRRRGVVGSPHFFTPHGSFFCPALEVHRDDEQHLRVKIDAERFERFLEDCFS